MLRKEKKDAGRGAASPTRAAPAEVEVVVLDSPSGASGADEVAEDSDVEEGEKEGDPAGVALHGDGLRDMKPYEVKGLRVKALREACSLRGLDSTGTKAVMYERLQPVLEAEREFAAAEVVPESPEAVPAGEELDANPDEVLAPEDTPEEADKAGAVFKSRASRRASRLSSAHELRPVGAREARRISRAHVAAAAATQEVPQLVAPSSGSRGAQAAAGPSSADPTPQVSPTEEEAVEQQPAQKSLFQGKTPAASRARAKSACPTTGRRKLRGPAALPDSPTEGVTPCKPVGPSASRTAQQPVATLPPVSPMQLCSSPPAAGSSGATKRPQDASPGAKAVGSSPAVRRVSKLRKSHDDLLKGLRAAKAAAAVDSVAQPGAVAAPSAAAAGAPMEADKAEGAAAVLHDNAVTMDVCSEPAADVAKASTAADIRAPVALEENMADATVEAPKQGAPTPASVLAKTPAMTSAPATGGSTLGSGQRSGAASGDPQKSAMASAAWERLQQRRAHAGPTPPSAEAPASAAVAQPQPQAKEPQPSEHKQQRQQSAKDGASGAPVHTAASRPAGHTSGASRPAAVAKSSHAQTLAEHRKRLEEEQRRKQAEWERKERELQERRRAAEAAEREERKRKAEEATVRRKEAEARSRAAAEERQRLHTETMRAEEARRKAEEAERRRRMVERAQEAQRKAAGAERRRKEEEVRRAEADRKAREARDAAAAAASAKRVDEQRRMAEKAQAAVLANAQAASQQHAGASSVAAKAGGTSVGSIGGSQSVGSGALRAVFGGQGAKLSAAAQAQVRPGGQSLATPAGARLGGAVRVTSEAQQEYVSYEISPYRENSESDEDDAPRKPVPRWAHRELLAHRLRAQQRVDPDTVFGRMGGTTADLCEVFENATGNKRKPNFKRRSSTGNWAGDLLSFQEQLRYSQVMGFSTSGN